MTMVDNQDISEEYLNGDFDFGFTAADEDELNSLVQLTIKQHQMK